MSKLEVGEYSRRTQNGVREQSLTGIESNRIESNHIPLMKKDFKQTPNRENKLRRAL